MKGIAKGIPMKNDIPFPPTLVRISAQAARDRMKERRGMSRGVPVDYEAGNVAVIRSPDGRLRTAYDLHAPTHRPLEEPGLGRVRYRVEHYPNDTSMHVPEVLGFESVQDLENRLGHIDRTAAALVILPDGDPATRRHLVVGRDENDLQQILWSLPEGARVIRAPIVTCDDQPLAVFTAEASVHRAEIRGAPSHGALAAMLRDRFPFLEDYGAAPAGDDEVLPRLAAHAERHGWDVAMLDTDDGGLRRLSEALRERENLNGPEGP